MLINKAITSKNLPQAFTNTNQAQSNLATIPNTLGVINHKPSFTSTN